MVVEREVVVGNGPPASHTLDQLLPDKLVASSFVDAQSPVLVAGSEQGSKFDREDRRRR